MQQQQLGMMAGVGMAGQAPAAADSAQVLFGHGSGQGNLTLVKARASEVRASLVDVIAALTTNAHQLNWDLIVKKFAVINQQVKALREQLRGILRQVVVHPRMVDDPGLAQALPIQLASRLTPQLEAQDALLLEQAEARMAAAGVPPERRYEEVDAEIEDYNRMIAELFGHKCMLDTEGPTRSEMALASKAIAKSLEELRALEAAAAATVVAGSVQAAGAAGAAAGVAIRAGLVGSGPAVKKARTKGPSREPLDPVLALLLPTEAVVRKG